MSARFGGRARVARGETKIGDVPADPELPLEAAVERGTVTVICSEKG